MHQDPLPCFPETLLGLRKHYGRRWAVTQALAYGGTPEAVLKRAFEFDQRRAESLGVRTAVGILSEGRHLADEASDYPARLRRAGWTVLRWGERWVVEPPSSA